MIMCRTKEKFYNWLGMKLYNGSEQFKNTIYGIYYQDVQLPNLNKINDLISENLGLKTKLNVYSGQFGCPVETTPDAPAEEKPKKRRKYTKHKKEVKE